MSDKKLVSLGKAVSYKGVDYAPGLNEMPEDAAKLAVNRKFGTYADGTAAPVAGLPEDFKPFPFEETMRRFEEGDDSSDVFNSLKFYQPKIKAAREAGISLKEYLEKETANQAESVGDDKGKDADDFPEGFPSRPKNTLLKLGKTYAEVSAMNRDALIELDGIAATTADEILVFIGKK